MLRRAAAPAAGAAYKTTVRRLAGTDAAAAANSGKAVLQLIRFDPEKNGTRVESYEYDKHHDYMVLDLLIAVKAHQDPTLAFRSSCCEGVCGSCAMNINGINSLACITFAQHVTTVGPLPNFPVIKDFVVDLRYFFQQYSFIRPFVRNANLHRNRIDGIVERYKAIGKSMTGVSPMGTDTYGPEDVHSAAFQRPQTSTEALFALADATVKAGDVSKLLAVLDRLEKLGVALSPAQVSEYVEGAHAYRSYQMKPKPVQTNKQKEKKIQQTNNQTTTTTTKIPLKEKIKEREWYFPALPHLCREGDEQHVLASLRSDLGTAHSNGASLAVHQRCFSWGLEKSLENEHKNQQRIGLGTCFSFEIFLFFSVVGIQQPHKHKRPFSSYPYSRREAPLLVKCLALLNCWWCAHHMGIDKLLHVRLSFTLYMNSNSSSIAAALDAWIPPPPPPPHWYSREVQKEREREQPRQLDTKRNTTHSRRNIIITTGTNKQKQKTYLNLCLSLSRRLNKGIHNEPETPHRTTVHLLFLSLFLSFFSVIFAESLVTDGRTIYIYIYIYIYIVKFLFVTSASLFPFNQPFRLPGEVALWCSDRRTYGSPMAICGRNVHNSRVRSCPGLLALALNYFPTLFAIAWITGAIFPYFHLYLPLLSKQYQLGCVSVFYLLYCYIGIFFTASMVYLNFFKAVFTCPGYVPHDVWQHTPLLQSRESDPHFPLPTRVLHLPPPATNGKFGPPQSFGGAAQPVPSPAPSIPPRFPLSSAANAGETAGTLSTPEASLAPSNTVGVVAAAREAPVVPAAPSLSFAPTQSVPTAEAVPPQPRERSPTTALQGLSIDPHNQGCAQGEEEDELLKKPPLQATTSVPLTMQVVPCQPPQQPSNDSGHEEVETPPVRNPYQVQLTTRACMRFCRYCDQYKPDRAYHCHMCQRCVFYMDHHCPWINNCVGRDNSKFFLLFTLYIPVGSVHIFLTMLYTLLRRETQLKGINFTVADDTWMMTVIYYATAMMMIAAMALVFGGFSGRFWCLLWKGETSMSEMIAERTGHNSVVDHRAEAISTYRTTLFGTDRRWWVLLLPFRPHRPAMLLMDGTDIHNLLPAPHTGGHVFFTDPHRSANARIVRPLESALGSGGDPPASATAAATPFHMQHRLQGSANNSTYNLSAPLRAVSNENGSISSSASSAASKSSVLSGKLSALRARLTPKQNSPGGTGNTSNLEHLDRLKLLYGVRKGSVDPSRRHRTRLMVHICGLTSVYCTPLLSTRKREEYEELVASVRSHSLPSLSSASGRTQVYVFSQTTVRLDLRTAEAGIHKRVLQLIIHISYDRPIHTLSFIHTMATAQETVPAVHDASDAQWLPSSPVESPVLIATSDSGAPVPPAAPIAPPGAEAVAAAAGPTDPPPAQTPFLVRLRWRLPLMILIMVLALLGALVAYYVLLLTHLKDEKDDGFDVGGRMALAIACVVIQVVLTLVFLLSFYLIVTSKAGVVPIVPWRHQPWYINRATFAGELPSNTIEAIEAYHNDTDNPNMQLVNSVDAPPEGVPLPPDNENADEDATEYTIPDNYSPLYDDWRRAQKKLELQLPQTPEEPNTRKVFAVAVGSPSKNPLRTPDDSDEMRSSTMSSKSQRPLHTASRFDLGDADLHKVNPYYVSLKTPSGYYRYCFSCHLYKPDMAYHCKVCQQCVLGYDHHCAFVNRCVGRNNYKTFLSFLVHATLSTFMGFVLLLIAIAAADDREAGKKWPWIVVGVVSLLLCFFMSRFLVKHIRPPPPPPSPISLLSDEQRQLKAESHRTTLFGPPRWYRWLTVLNPLPYRSDDHPTADPPVVPEDHQAPP
eukprot:gene9753-6840_t